MRFYFDYIYYRITQAYFKWDGRTGTTAIIGITMIQLLVLLDIFTVIIRIRYDRDESSSFVQTGKWIIIAVYIVLFILNYKKYSGTYNKLKSHWKNESKAKRFYKGLLVILSMILPWIPLIVIGVYW